MRSDSSRTARWPSPGGRDSSPGPTAARLRRAVTGMCQSSLAKTLKELEEVGIAERKVHLDRPVAVEYRLSPKGAALFEAIRDLERWATRWVMNSVPREVTQ